MARSHASRKTAAFAADSFQSALLGWYDRHRRVLPWRAAAGTTPDPYHVWLSEIMLQQTTVPAVMAYFTKFIGLWPSVHDLAAAPDETMMQAWAGLGYYARARNLLKCARVIAKDHGGIFPADEEKLLELPGIGPYTAAAISAIAFGQQATVVDGNIERVTARVFAITEPMPKSKPRIREQAHIMFQDVARPGDFAQGLMDLGATVCIPANPRCALCPVSGFCEAKALGIAAGLPAKSPKKPRPARSGTAFWLVTEDGRVALETRSEDRMLGGMAGLPTTDWDAAGSGFEPSVSLRARLRPGGTVYHTFTHFDLTLEVQVATITAKDLPGAGGWKLVPISAINEAGLPTVFKKVAKLQISSQGLS